MAKEKDPLIEGNKYGFLTYLGNRYRDNNITKASFLCDCGELVVKDYDSVKRILKKGKTSPCCKRSCPVASTQYGKDYTGSKFGMLTIKAKLQEKKSTSFLYLCECDCGNQVKLVSNKFTGANSDRSCGCRMHQGKQKDITGVKKGKLTAIESTGVKSGNGDYVWRFACDCGNEHETTIGNFNCGSTTSCGCAVKNAWKKREVYHGMSKTSVYKSWCKIKERCYNENDREYAHYGAVGIGMCDAWYNDFKQFYADMGDKPDDGKRYTVDRIDNTKDYTPENCRWGTVEDQARNKLGLQTNNTSNFKGVQWDEKSPGKMYAKAAWRNLDGTIGCKSFSVKTYGDELAFFLACEYRQHQIDLLNLQGAGYSEQHLINEHYNRW